MSCQVFVTQSCLLEPLPIHFTVLCFSDIFKSSCFFKLCHIGCSHFFYTDPVFLCFCVARLTMTGLAHFRFVKVQAWSVMPAWHSPACELPCLAHAAVWSLQWCFSSYSTIWLLLIDTFCEFNVSVLTVGAVHYHFCRCMCVNFVKFLLIAWLNFMWILFGLAKHQWQHLAYARTDNWT